MNKFYKTPIIISIVMLLSALFNLPAGYYTLLRIIVCGTAVYLGFIAKGITKISWVWVLGFIAILFNPFLPIHLDREMWGFIDIIVGFIFFAGIFALSGEGATKSIFKTRSFRIFRKIALVISLCILVVIGLIFTISGVKNHLRKKAIRRRIPPGFVLEEQRQSFDIKTARPVDGYFIETYSKGKIIIIGHLEDGKENGIWRIYDKYGNLRAEKEYSEGILTNAMVFDEKGELIRKYPCKEGKIIGDIDLSDTAYVGDYDVATRETVSFVNMDYEDDNIKAKLLPPYFLTLAELKNLFSKEYDYKKYLCFEIDIEIINKTKIIKNMQYGLIGGHLKDNYGNLITITSRIPFGSPDLRFGDKKKITFESLELPLKNAVYFYFSIPKNTLWNLNDMNFTFPAFFITEKTNSNNIENR